MALTSPPTAGKLRATVLEAIITEVQPLHAAVTADQNLTSNSTTLQDVTELVVAVEASATYEFEMIFAYKAGTTADIKAGWTYPTGSTFDFFCIGLDTALAMTEQMQISAASGDSRPWGGAGTGSPRFVSARGRLAVGSTAGNLQVQAAQNTAAVETEVVLAGSYLTLRRVS